MTKVSTMPFVALVRRSGRVAELSMSCCWVVMETLGEDVVH